MFPQPSAAEPILAVQQPPQGRELGIIFAVDPAMDPADTLGLDTAGWCPSDGFLWADLAVRTRRWH